jgi:hypothetical protein
LIESSNPLEKAIIDGLLPIDKNLSKDEEIEVLTPQASGSFWTRPLNASSAE